MCFKFYLECSQTLMVTSDGRLFQVLAAATGNARSPIVESRVSGTASVTDTIVTRSPCLAQG